MARKLMQVKNGETRVLKRGWSMHLSGYDPLAYCFIVNLTRMHFVICKLNSSLGASSSKVLTG